MHHSYLDKFAAGDSVVHRRDPRAKVLAFLALAAATVLVPTGLWWPFVALAAVLAALWAMSGVPLGYLFGRVLLLSPFVIFSVVLFPFLAAGAEVWGTDLGPLHFGLRREGLELAGNMAAKFALSVLVLSLMFSTMRFQHFLYALRRFRVPELLVMQLGFLYRYLYVVHDEGERMLRARDARGAAGPRLLLWRATAGLLGALFLRSFRRSQRIYWAMLARGFTGQVRLLEQLKWRPADAIFAALVLAATVTITVGWVWAGR